MIPFYLLYAIVSFWGLCSLRIVKDYINYILFFLIFLILFSSVYIYYKDSVAVYKFLGADVIEQIHKINKYKTNDEPVGVILEYSLFWYNYISMYPYEAENFVPFLLHDPNIRYPHINVKSILDIYNKDSILKEDELECKLYKSGFENYLAYFYGSYIPGKQSVPLNLLINNCDTTFIKSIPYVVFAQNCTFKKNACSGIQNAE